MPDKATAWHGQRQRRGQLLDMNLLLRIMGLPARYPAAPISCLARSISIKKKGEDPMHFRRILLTIAVISSCLCGTLLLAAEPQSIPAEQFSKLHKMIKPQLGESRWLEIPWQTDVHAARQKAAAEGKPLFVYSGGGATGIGAC
jgi:hypothetical protein